MARGFTTGRGGRSTSRNAPVYGKRGEGPGRYVKTGTTLVMRPSIKGGMRGRSVPYYTWMPDPKPTPAPAPAAPKPAPKPKPKAAPKPARRVAPKPKVTAAKAPPPPAPRPPAKPNMPNYNQMISDLRGQLSQQSQSFGTKIQDYQNLLADQQRQYQQRQAAFEKQLQSSLAGQASQFQKQLQSSLASQASQFQRQQLGLQRQYETTIANQAAQFQTQRQALEEQSRRFEEAAQQSQQQLMIGLQQRDRAPAEVKMAESGAAQQGLTRRGTTGYFGRQGMRIGSLNVPTSGLTISADAASRAASGSFM